MSPRCSPAAWTSSAKDLELVVGVLPGFLKLRLDAHAKGGGIRDLDGLNDAVRCSGCDAHADTKVTLEIAYKHCGSKP